MEKQEALDLIKQDSYNFNKLPYHFQNDEVMIKEFLDIDLRVITKLPHHFLSNIELMTDVCYKEHFCLVFVNEDIKKQVRENIYQRRLQDTNKDPIITWLLNPNNKQEGL